MLKGASVVVVAVHPPGLDSRFARGSGAHSDGRGFKAADLHLVSADGRLCLVSHATFPHRSFRPDRIDSPQHVPWKIDSVACQSFLHALGASDSAWRRAHLRSFAN